MTTISHAASSDRGLVGCRNEDRWFADPREGLFGVVDGMTGAGTGELAAQIVATTLPLLLGRRLRQACALSSAAACRLLVDAVVELSACLRQQTRARPGLEGMGATVALALIRGAVAAVGHLGDSRAYLLSRGRLERLTRDHSLAQLLVDSGDLTQAQAECHASRKQLARFVGMKAPALPEARALTLRPGDRLLLCTDGLTDMLPDTTLHALLTRYPTPREACKELIAAACAEGGMDNLTAVVIGVEA
jgi:protein phosphatase